jgi:DNA-binding transcriptional ArsR family regulator
MVRVTGEADLAAVAAAIGDPARARMLEAMLGGRALPASELARHARVAAPTASSHLRKLLDAGLVRVRRSGRYRLHELNGPAVAEALEALQSIAPPRPVRSLKEDNRMRALRAGRSCYDHLAGELGVGLTDRLCELGALERDTLVLRDPAPLAALGVDVDAARVLRRQLTRSCVDWTERRPHLAGALGAAVLDALLMRDWVRRGDGRAVRLTDAGRAGLADRLGVAGP